MFRSSPQKIASQHGPVVDLVSFKRVCVLVVGGGKHFCSLYFNLEDIVLKKENNSLFAHCQEKREGKTLSRLYKIEVYTFRSMQ